MSLCRDTRHRSLSHSGIGKRPWGSVYRVLDDLRLTFPGFPISVRGPPLLDESPPMTLQLAAAFLSLLLLVSIVRILVGPTREDRLLVAQLAGTMGTALLMILGETTGSPAYRDLALVFVALAVTTTAAFSRNQDAMDDEREPNGGAFHDR